MALLLLLNDDIATCNVVTLLLNDGVTTRNVTALLLRWCYLAMALQLATLQHCYYDAIVALLVNDGVTRCYSYGTTTHDGITTLLLLWRYCSVMALQNYYCWALLLNNGTAVATRDTATLQPCNSECYGVVVGVAGTLQAHIAATTLLCNKWCYAAM